MKRQIFASGALLAAAVVIGGALSWNEEPPPTAVLSSARLAGQAEVVCSSRADVFDAMWADQQIATPVTPAVAEPAPVTRLAAWSSQFSPVASAALFEAMRGDHELAAVSPRMAALTLFDAMRADLDSAEAAHVSTVEPPDDSQANLPKFDLLASTTQELVAPKDCGCDRDPKLGTALVWNNSLEAANAQAEKEGKLVFLIHVSGNFAIPGFT